MTERLKVTVADGKYTVIQHENGSTTALRYGEPWPAFEHGGVDNLHLALAYEVDELRQTLRLFRDFWNFYVTQTKLGANHHHAIWQQIAAALGPDNDKSLTAEEWKLITGPHFAIEKQEAGR